ncbi:hypothetical protein BBK36DRAFT_1158309 [Trichoderma citrinoviride]|uniref:Glucan 1, 4-alpha-glucosidase n=1 Tax=Trichoderma citrinoviride TaxID=58853 RepID=A0A2T4BDQ7_9HYPO|nr:hypothetical protein BBK36DRAFT_1158309 [Trichoderma citrinoviride]PTB67473.1 hypothetical protein BBK36DRAFT_1158309 [Trichoderma citrinoviride]
MASQPFQHNSAPKRPRLSLKINTCGSSVPSRPVKGFHVDPTDRTACNTLSNVYATAIERSTPVQAEPLTAINTLQSFSLKTPAEPRGPKLKIKTPYVAAFPQTPTTETSASPPQKMDIAFPSTMTPTPPMSAGAVDSSTSSAFPFSPRDLSSRARTYGVTSPCSPVEPLLSRRYTAAYTTGAAPAPYTHPHSLHSILRNSPLPPRTAIPASPRRQSLRLQEKAAKRVGYNNPLTQTIITNKYTKSHIDLLVEEASPASPSFSPIGGDRAINLKQAFSPNEIENGGQTPGPFEDMRRKLAALSGGGAGTPPPSSSLSPSETGGIRKRKRKEKKRQWVWTIGVADEEEEDDERVGGAIAASRAEAASASASARGRGTATAKAPSHNDDDDDGDEAGAVRANAVVPDIQMVPDTPTTSIESSSSSAADSAIDVDMSDASSVVSEDFQGVFLPVGPAASFLASELDVKTPTAPPRSRAYYACNGYNKRKRDTPIPELAEAQDTHVSVDS